MLARQSCDPPHLYISRPALGQPTEDRYILAVMPDLSPRQRYSRPAGGCRRAPARYVRSICSPRSSRAAPGSPRSAARARRAPPRRAHRQIRLIERTCWPAPIASSTRRPRDRSTGCPLSTGSATRLSASCGRRAVGAHLWSMSFSWIVCTSTYRGPGSTPRVRSRVSRRLLSPLCSRWATTLRMGEDAPFRPFTGATGTG